MEALAAGGGFAEAEEPDALLLRCIISKCMTEKDYLLSFIRHTQMQLLFVQEIRHNCPSRYIVMKSSVSELPTS